MFNYLKNHSSKSSKNELTSDIATLIFYGLLGILALTFVVFFVTLDMSHLLAAMKDGAGYYFQLARNIVNGHGISFDGVHITNSFQPLWMALLVVVFKTVTGTSEFLYRLVGVLDIGLIVLASVIFYRVLRSLVSPYAALAGGLAYITTAFLNINLMESPLILLTTSILFWYAWRYRIYEHHQITTDLGFGWFLGLAILARLDIGFLAVIIGLFYLLRCVYEPRRRREHFSSLILIVIGSSILVVPYLLYNQYAFGSIVPIGGRIELVSPRTSIHEILNMLKGFSKPQLLTLIASVIYLIWYYFWRRHSSIATSADKYLSGTVVILAITCLSHAINEVLFMKWLLYWHFTLLIPLVGAISAIFWQYGLDRFPRRAMFIMSFALLAVTFGLFSNKAITRFVRADVDNHWTSKSYETAVWIRDHIEPGTRIAMDRPEVIGFFSERQTVDLSGLCSNVEFQRVIQEQRLHTYLDQIEVQYLVLASIPDNTESINGPETFYSGRPEKAMVSFSAGLFDNKSDTITVERIDEVYRSSSRSSSNLSQQGLRQRKSVVVWRFKPVHNIKEKLINSN